MKVIKRQSIKNPVVVLKILDNRNLVAVDNETTIRYMEIETLNLVSGFKAKIHHKRYKDAVVAIDNKGEYLATLSGDAKKSILISTQTKKPIGQVSRHKGEVSCVGIDPKSRYMFSCGEDGKTFAMDITSGKLIFTLPAHADTINDVAFSQNGNWVAVCSYDRKISLYNLVTMTTKEKLKAHSKPVMKLQFFGKNKLLSIDKNSSAIIWDINTSKVEARLQGIHDDVVAITISGDHQFLFLGTKLGYIILYDLNNYEQLSANYIKSISPITRLTFDDVNNHLVIGTEDGFISFYDIYEGKDTLVELLKKRDFDAIQHKSKENPILAYTDIYHMALNFWEHSLEKATLFLQAGQIDKAHILLKNFEKIPGKKRIIQKLFNQYEQYTKFVEHAKAGRIALAYGLANSFKTYQSSNIYKALEKQWKQAFLTARKYALDPRGMERAKEILAPYRGVAEKSILIQDLLTKGNIYKRFREAFGQQNFRICSELINQYAFLKEFPEYEKIKKYADSVYIKVQDAIKKGEYATVSKLIRILSDFEDFKEEAILISKEVEQKQAFFSAVKNEDMKSAYNLLDKYEELLETKEGALLEKQWEEAIQRAKSFAIFGDVNGLKDALKPYFSIDSKRVAIANMFSWCYITQLEQAMKNNENRQTIEKGIKNYILYFGITDSIETFYEMFHKKYTESKLSLENLNRGSMNMWRPSMIVESILD